MKEVWYFVLIILMLSFLASFSTMTTPTGAFVANLPPQWDYPTSEFTVEGERLTVKLEDAFFDPDDDPLSFSVSPSEGLSAGVYGDVLIVMADGDGSVVVAASDGQSVVSKTLKIYRKN